ncbi:trichothecene biosynthesis enzyme [Grosmannia clavigera kw1407]|uniref:Trichothecene biosynthesis enzyme n=1 Tax=Grosmannia clavigera (strain kw1407 / UAMH 11150) TaxID=655863 RepID=F0XGM6_GROCL|nr:trichothecene biosynthesis enzyme [Grosmannia clavigera kw1407]EFX02913.1 trichothecene biosynthesis enzyme [Grosmannia clavigera kw1407]
MRLLSTVAAVAVTAAALPATTPTAVASALARHRAAYQGKECPPLKRGSFNIDQYQLYPENADWDEDSCLVYFGALWNASVAIYDPYADDMVAILNLDNVTNTGTEHVGGVAWDRFTGLITILVDSAAPWSTGGADVSGSNLVLKWNPVTASTLWTANLTATTQGRYGAFQDVETDDRGNTYVVGTFPRSIVRVSADGVVDPWYAPSIASNETIDTTVPGLGGLVALPQTGNAKVLLANDAANGSIYRFDISTTCDHVPYDKPLTPVAIVPDVLYNDTDAIYAPPRYDGTVLLVSSHASGIQVLRARDASWTTADYLGTVPIPPAGTSADVVAALKGSFTTAAVQMGNNSVYMVNEWFTDAFVAGGVAGNRTLFPMPDITAAIDALLAA